VRAASGANMATIDLGGVEHLDMAGAWLIDRSKAQLSAEGIEADYSRMQPEQQASPRRSPLSRLRDDQTRPCRAADRALSDIGESVYGAGRDLIDGVGFLAGSSHGRVAGGPSRALARDLDPLSFRSVRISQRPIIVLINFLVGASSRSRAYFQLQRFGATPFAVNLIGILVLRELGVLLTSIY